MLEHFARVFALLRANLSSSQDLFSYCIDSIRSVTSNWDGLAGAAVGLAGLRRRKIEIEDEEPIRGELCSLERLEQHAATLASTHQIGKDQRRAEQLLKRLDDNGAYLTEAYQSIAEGVRRGQIISPAAEWLMDNFHIVQEQLREIEEDLPEHYLRELPKLADGPYAGYPRVYSIAIALIEHSDCRLDAEMLRRFMQSYQVIAPLKIGELWAIAIMLRLALVENLRRLAKQSLWARAERERADAWADEIIKTADRQPTEVFIILAEYERKGEQLSPPFSVQLLQRLRDQGPGVASALSWCSRTRGRRRKPPSSRGGFHRSSGGDVGQVSEVSPRLCSARAPPVEALSSFQTLGS